MRHLRRLLAFGLLAVVVIACGASSEGSVSTLLKKWNDNSFSTISHAVFGTSTGNAGQDGVIDSAQNITDVDDAEKAAEEALANGDMSTVDSLTRQHPTDPHLHTLRGALALVQGDTQTFVSDYAFSVPAGQISPINDRIAQLNQAGTAIGGRFVSVNQCDEFYGSLAQLYRQRFEISQRQADLDMAAQIDQQHSATCATVGAGG